MKRLYDRDREFFELSKLENIGGLAKDMHYSKLKCNFVIYFIFQFIELI